MSIRPMKWHIFNYENEPLCWDGMALEFDTKEEAEAFFDSVKETSWESDEYFYGANIREGIFYYDGGYLNATHLRCAYDDEECETYLRTTDGEKFIIELE